MSCFFPGCTSSVSAFTTSRAARTTPAKVVALGGPSVSSAPDYYPDVDLLHCGEAGDATLRLFHHLDETVERPGSQMIFRTVERLPMSDFPTPAYHRINIRDYLLGSVQFSSGCPFTCEFCDIPSL